MTVALELPDKMLIGGEWVDAAGGRPDRGREPVPARAARQRAARDAPRTWTAR